MKVLLLGATGRTGKLILDEALKRGFELNCLVRYPDKIKKGDDRIHLFQGLTTDSHALDEAMEGCESVINALNVSRTSDFPWARLRTPKTFLSNTMKSLIPLAHKHGANRVVICSAWGVGESREETPGWFNWFIDHSNIGAAYEDHDRQENLLKASDLAWTIVRPSGLTNSKKEQKIIESFANKPKPKMTISRGSVAKYMVEALMNDTLIGKVPVISA